MREETIMTETATPRGIRCGHCHHYHPSIADVRACAAERANAAWGLQPEPTTPVTPCEADSAPAVAAEPVAVPDSKYALGDALAGIKFYEVDTGREGTKWAGRRFVTHLVGAPGTWAQYPVRGDARDELFAAIRADSYTDPESGQLYTGPKAAAVRYSREFTVCARCGSPLSDEFSRANGLGPVCITKF